VLGDLPGVKRTAKAKMEYIRQEILKKNYTKVQELIDRPMLLAIEWDRRPISQYLLEVLHEMYLRILPSGVPALLRNRLIRMGPFERRVYYLGKAIQMGKLEIASWMFRDVDDGSDLMEVTSTIEDLYNLAMIARESPDRELYQKILRIYEDRVTTTIADEGPDDELEFITAHPIDFEAEKAPLE